MEIFDDALRSSSEDRRKQKQIREPSSNVQNAHTPASGIRRLREFIQEASLPEDLLDRRFCIIHVWRSISGPVFKYPMVFCDSTTVRGEDLVAVERRSVTRVGEIQMAAFNQNQRWY